MAPMRVIQGTAARRRQSAIEAAYDHFRVDRQGNLVSASLLLHSTTVNIRGESYRLKDKRQAGVFTIPSAKGSE